MVPFAASDLNVITLQNLWIGVKSYVPEAFVISMVGYVVVLIGGKLWKRKDSMTDTETGGGLLNLVPRQSLLLMSYPGILAMQALICLLFQAWILYLYFSGSGFGFNLRLYTFEHPFLRPIAVIIGNYSMIIGSHCFARYVETKEQTMLSYVLLLSVGLFFFGSRANVFLIYFMPAVCYLIALRRRVSLFKLLIAAVTIVSILILAGELRAGAHTGNSARNMGSIIAFRILFGNTFSDLRDFALVMSAWSGHFWMGRTYLAALMGFIPRSLSTFRSTWDIGVKDTTMLGLDPNTHPGLRPGYFGEPYFNFGYIGVVAAGLFIGRVLRKVDTCVKQELEGASPSIMRAFSYTVLLTVMTDTVISGAMATVFVMAAVFMISSICRGLVTPVPSNA